MEDNKNMFETLIDKAEHYGKTSIDLYRLKAIDKSADVLSSVTSHLVISILAIFFFLILNIGLGLLIGEYVGKTYYGFFILAGFYALLGVTLYAFRNQLIKTPVSNSIITQALK